jgi:hypothetical protein
MALLWSPRGGQARQADGRKQPRTTATTARLALDLFALALTGAPELAPFQLNSGEKVGPALERHHPREKNNAK